MTANDIMLRLIREQVEALSAAYHYGDRSRRARFLLDEIQAYEYARVMWHICWNKCGEEDEARAVRNFIEGTKVTLRDGFHFSKGTRAGWEKTLTCAQSILTLTP